MDETVSAFFGAPVAVRTGVLSSRFTAIAVDPQIMTTEGKAYDIIFIGTTKGRVLKVINSKSADSKEDVNSDRFGMIRQTVLNQLVHLAGVVVAKQNSLD